MKLISCYVEGYGKIKGKEFIFNEGLTSFFWENGEGKTTLASFLKAMLYGLESRTSKTFREREHFYPFDGGRFGGNLHLEAKGKRYKIERFFDEKSETRDSLTVYEDGEIIAPPADLGKYLLDVDKESFERTLFLRHEDLEISSTSGIHDRLNRFLEGGEEEGGLDEAIEALDKAAKVYKKRGGGDKITEAKDEVEGLKAKIENVATVKAALEGKYERERILRAELANAQERATAAQKGREIASQFEHYDSLLARANEAEASAAQIREKYPLGVPTLEETNEFNEYLGASNELQIRIDEAGLSAKEEEKFALLSARFQEGAPDNDTLAGVGEKIARISTLRAEASAQNRTPTEREIVLEERFSRRKPTATEFASIEERLAAYKTAKGELERTPALTQGGVAATPSAKKYGVWAALSALCAAIGVILLAAGSLPVGAALAIAGGLGLFAVGFLYLNKKSSGQGVAAPNPLYESLTREMAALEQGVRDLLFPFGYGGEANVELAFERLKGDFADYEAMAKVRENAEAAALQATRERAALEQELSAFFSAYGVEEGDYIDRLAALKVALGDWRSLASRKREGEEACQKAIEELTTLREKMTAYRQKYGLLTVDCAEIIEDIKALERYARTAREDRENAAKYLAEKGLDERAQEEQEDVDSLLAKVNDLYEELSSLGKQIDEDERTAELLEGYEADKVAAEERLKEYKRKHKLLTAAGAILAEASASLRKKYVEPVLNAFLENAKVLEEALGERVEMTKDFTLRFERNGVSRSEKHLSSGQRSLCALCFRLALIRNMYREQTPFMVLDDPFLALDETHLLRARGVLQALSKDMQLIYFTCHSSRNV